MEPFVPAATGARTSGTFKKTSEEAMRAATGPKAAPVTASTTTTTTTTTAPATTSATSTEGSFVQRMFKHEPIQGGPSSTTTTTTTTAAPPGYTPGLPVSSTTTPMSTPMGAISSTAAATSSTVETTKTPSSTTAASESAFKEREQLLERQRLEKADLEHRQQEAFGGEADQFRLEREALITRQREERERLLSKQRWQREELEREQMSQVSAPAGEAGFVSAAPTAPETSTTTEVVGAGGPDERIFEFQGKEYVLVDEFAEVSLEETGGEGEGEWIEEEIEREEVLEEEVIPYTEVPSTAAAAPMPAPVALAPAPLATTPVAPAVVPVPLEPAILRPSAVAAAARPGYMGESGLVNVVTTKTKYTYPKYGPESRMVTTRSEVLPAEEAAARMATGTYVHPGHVDHHHHHHRPLFGRKKTAAATTTATGLPVTTTTTTKGAPAKVVAAPPVAVAPVAAAPPVVAAAAPVAVARTPYGAPYVATAAPVAVVPKTTVAPVTTTTPLATAAPVATTTAPYAATVPMTTGTNVPFATAPLTTGAIGANPTIDAARTIVAGGVPSNAALTSVIGTTVATLEQQKAVTLDPTDRLIVQDVEDVLVSTQALLQQRNQGEHFQKMLLHGKEAARQMPLTRQGVSTLGAGAHAAPATDFRQLLSSLRGVLWGLVQSPNFRKDFVDLWSLLYDIVFFDAQSGELRQEFTPMAAAALGRKGFRRAFAETAGNVRLTAHEHKHGLGAEAAPSYAGLQRVHARRERLPSGEQILHYEGPPREGFPVELGRPQEEFEEEEFEEKEFEEEFEEEEFEYEEPISGGYGQNLFYDTKYESVQGRQGDIRTQELFNRLVYLLRNLGSMDEWRDAVSDLFVLFDSLKLSARHYGTQISGVASTSGADYHIGQMRIEAQLLLEEFLGPGGMNPFLGYANSLWGNLRSDETALEFFQEFRDYLRISLARPELADDAMHRQRGLDLIYSARSIGDRYRYHADAEGALREMRLMTETLANDPILRNFSENLNKLIRDLTLDEYGRPSTALTATHLRHLKSLLVPLFNAHLTHVPLPRVEASTPKYDFWADNMILNGRALTPDNVKIEMASKSDLNVNTLTTNNLGGSAWGDTDLTITLYNIEILLENINFWFRRKTFPKIEDEGTATADVRGTGATILIRLSTYGEPTLGTAAMSALSAVPGTGVGQAGTAMPAGPRPLFHVRQVIADFDKCNIKIQRAAHHKFLLTMMTLIFKRTIKRNVELRVEQVLQRVLDAVNERVAAQRYRFTSSTTGMAGRLVSSVPGIGPKLAPLFSSTQGASTLREE